VKVGRHEVHLVVVSTHEVQFVAHVKQTLRPSFILPVGHAVSVTHLFVLLSRKVSEAQAQVPFTVSVYVSLH